MVRIQLVIPKRHLELRNAVRDDFDFLKMVTKNDNDNDTNNNCAILFRHQTDINTIDVCNVIVGTI